MLTDLASITRTNELMPVPGRLLLSAPVALVVVMFLAGCSMNRPADMQQRVQRNRAELVRKIEERLQHADRALVSYSADQLERRTSGPGGTEGGHVTSGYGPYPTGAIGTALHQPYTQTFEPEKFTRVELWKIAHLLDAIYTDPDFRHDLGRVVNMTRSQETHTVHGLRKDGSAGTFSMGGDQSEPGGAIMFERGRPEILFCEPSEERGSDAYVSTPHARSAADVSTFHGHHQLAGPSTRDLITAAVYQLDSVIITDRGNSGNRIRVNVSFVSGSGKGLDLSTVSVPDPSTIPSVASLR